MIIVGRITPDRMFRITILSLWICVVSVMGRDGWQQESSYSWREVKVADGRPGFTRMGMETGIDFLNSLSTNRYEMYQNILYGSCVELVAVHGDGWVDIFWGG